MRIMKLFQNETGAKTSIFVETQEMDALFSIERDNKTIHALLTRMEAKELHAALGKALRGPPTLIR